MLYFCLEVFMLLEREREWNETYLTFSWWYIAYLMLVQCMTSWWCSRYQNLVAFTPTFLQWFMWKTLHNNWESRVVKYSFVVLWCLTWLGRGEASNEVRKMSLSFSDFICGFFFTDTVFFGVISCEPKRPISIFWKKTSIISGLVQLNYGFTFIHHCQEEYTNGL